MGLITMKSCGSRNKRLVTTLSLVSTSLTNLAVSFVHLNKFDVLTFKQRLGCKQGSCNAPSWLNLGEPSHIHIHLTTDHDSTHLNAPRAMGNAESPLPQPPQATPPQAIQ